MKKLIMALGFMAAAIIIGCTTINYAGPRQNIVNLQKSFEASCSIIVSGIHSGAGVLLDTGYIITAAHILDMDEDGVVSEEEGEEVYVRFAKSKRMIKALVAFTNGNYRFNGDEDIVLLRTKERVDIDGIELLTQEQYEKLNVGEELIAIGTPVGDSLHVSQGILSTPFHGKSRASTDAYFGSSGGGMFLRDSRLIGIVTGIIHKRINSSMIITIPVIENGIITGDMSGELIFDYQQTIFGWTHFLSSDKIYDFAHKNNIMSKIYK